jgi:predicted DNA binding protein
MKFCEIGIYHHDCWFTDAITQFPELHIREISARITKTESETRTNSACYRLFTQNSHVADDFVRRILSKGMVSEAKILAKNPSTALIEVSWRAPRTSYDAVLGSGCSIASSCYAKEGYETYSLFADEPNQIKRLLDEMRQIGQTKVFSLKNERKNTGSYGLTQKQRQAIVSAISMGYYEWPKKANLEELAARLGVKRRTLQENLRKAETKVFGSILDELGRE